MPAAPAKLRKIAPRRLREPLTRSEMMARVRSKDTKPEVKARSAVHALEQHFRVHVSDLPGKPDLANKAHRWAIFVHGCFWHSHKNCQLASKPRTNIGYWSEKLARNRARDAVHEQALRERGFNVLILWECDTRNDAKLRAVLEGFFQGFQTRTSSHVPFEGD